MQVDGVAVDAERASETSDFIEVVAAEAHPVPPSSRAGGLDGCHASARGTCRAARRAARYNKCNQSCKKVALVVDLMSLEEQVDKEFAVARRRAWGRGVQRLLCGKAGTGALLSFEETRRAGGASGGIRRGRSTVEVSRIVGSAGKCEQFDEGFMPLRGASPERWKRVDRAFRLGIELPPVSLYRLGGAYFVQDGNHRVSVARFHGVEWMDAEVTEFWSPRHRLLVEARGALPAQAPVEP